jgi:hypothetical protein
MYGVARFAPFSVHTAQGAGMTSKLTTSAALPGLLTVALLSAGCGDPVSPAHPGAAAPHLSAATTAAAAAAGIALDQLNGSLSESGAMLIKGFNPTNPHNGDAIVAQFVWSGSTNIIDSVTDVLTTAPYTPVGNKYTLVEYVTAGGISMATYVATNVQNFPDTYSDPSGTYILAVRANLSRSVSDGGVLISAWSGVNTVAAQALGAHQSASGAGSVPTVADAGALPVGAGALAYGITLSNALVGRTSPAGFTSLMVNSDAQLVEEADYAVSATVGSVDPQWTWSFNSPASPNTWLASAFVLNPPLHLVFTVQPSTTLPLTTITPAVRVTAVDALGNAVPSFTGSVTVAIGQNGGLLMPGTLSGTTTVAAVNGVATFSDLSIDQPGNGYTLQVTASGLTGAGSAPFNIGAF